MGREEEERKEQIIKPPESLKGRIFLLVPESPHSPWEHLPVTSGNCVQTELTLALKFVLGNSFLIVIRSKFTLNKSQL